MTACQVKNDMSTRVCIHKDGSFDIETPCGVLRGCRPAIDHIPVCPTKVEIGMDSIVYHLESGKVSLHFETNDEGVELSATLSGIGHAPRWFSPLAEACVEGFDSCFRQGIGFAGATGPLNFTRLGDEWNVPSYLLLGLFAADGEKTMTIAPHEHRDFLFRADLRQVAWRHNFRNREIDATRRTAELGFRTERIAIGEELELPTISFRFGEGLFNTLRAMALEIAKTNRARSAACGGPVSRPCYHYCSWYNRFRHFNHKDLRQLLTGFDQTDSARHIQTVQIDGDYIPSLGDWLLPCHKWPQTIKPAIAEIIGRGYAAGVWVGPFMVGSKSELAKKHPDWLLRDLDGNLIAEWKNYRGQRFSPEHYILDTSHPEAMDYLVRAFTTFREWGVTFFKTDFLEWGHKDSTKVRRHTPGKTGAQYFDDVMRAIRQAIGPESHWLGCISFFAPAIGYCDSMRVTSDVGVAWGKEGGNGNDGVGGGIQNMIEESYATLYQNNILWQCDPDVVFIRDRYTHMSEAEVFSLACWNGLLGHSINTSDEIGALPPDRLALWRWMRPQVEPWTAELPYFAEGHPFRVVVRDYPQANGWAVLLLNAENKPQFGRCQLRHLVGLDSARCFRWCPGDAEDIGLQTEIICELDIHHSELLFVSRDGQPPPQNLNLGGSFDV